MKKRKKDKILARVFLFGVLVFGLTMVFFTYKLFTIPKKVVKDDSYDIYALLKNSEVGKDKNKVSNEKSEDSESKGTQNQNDEVSIKITAIGNCTLGSLLGASGETFDYIYDKEGNNKYFFSGINNQLTNDDITISNLQGVISDSYEMSNKKAVFKGMSKYTKILKEGSIEAVNLANHHMGDYGDKGITDTKENLKNDGINYFGNDEKPIINVKGVKVGLLGYEGKTISKEALEKDIKALKNEANLVVVSFNWQDRTNYPNEEKKQIGRYAVDSGADLVIGQNIYTIQGIENYKGKNIIYSLGNFIFGGSKNPKNRDAYIYKQEFIFDGDKKLKTVNKESILPIDISSTEGKNDYKPIILEGERKNKILEKIEYK